ncbi:MAG: aminotransferase class I/II-fold pyridoxal phosphate-dependent enzyme [Kordiimonadaceae bacterium]|nr:aminotransferase class I/II-fold pyridoxal phosphate-dependent enzyme [Kordiimonadaceae bacterium]
MTYREPWSKKHKSVTANTPFNLSNSFAEPLTSDELIRLSLERGDDEIVEQYKNHILTYTPNGGSLDLREEIAGLYGPDIGPENIVVFPGAQVALQTAANAIVDESCHSIVFTPAYQSVQQAPLHAGSEITKIRLDPESGWQVDPDQVEAAIKPNSRYMVINEPYNPAGTLMSRETQSRLKDIAGKNGIYILSDEVYRLLEHDEKDRLPAMADFYDKGISAVTLSKPWGGCGITIGWLAMQDMNLRQKIIDTMYFATACPSRASEIQAIMTLRASDYILERNLKIIRQNVVLLDQFVEKYSEFFEWVRPVAGAIAYMKFKGPFSSNELGEQLAEHGISIKPAYVFSDENLYSDYFRIGYGEAIMPKALDALIRFVEAHQEVWRSQLS